MLNAHDNSLNLQFPGYGSPGTFALCHSAGSFLRFTPRGLTPESTTSRIPAALAHAKRCSMGKQVEPVRYLFNVNPSVSLLPEVLTYNVG